VVEVVVGMVEHRVEGRGDKCKTLCTNSVRHTHFVLNMLQNCYKNYNILLGKKFWVERRKEGVFHIELELLMIRKLPLSLIGLL
jgi:hypothetical protein